ncbi:phosphotriesterase [Frondihabitans sp. VKM Ac-2883]|uniref:phosphotriesterase family protein n=1 Tax=Frondihabitans sp. VKM Ac-2883 TaxID=2783823 RepID=UPI002107D09B|nr:phosphotriesterase-related protein [Frondihabitans sp. VKM Ac-2883]
MGVTLPHEHVFLTDSEIHDNFDVGWDEKAAVAQAVSKLNELKVSGIDTIVDLTVVGLGRNVQRIERVAAQSSVNIVVATGYYTFQDLSGLVEFRDVARPAGTSILTEWFIGDIRDGIFGTSTRAGILKCATDKPGVTAGVEKVLRSVAQAHRETGVPISTHTDSSTRRGLDQQRVFREEGVDLSRVVIGHCGDTTDIDYLKELLDAGSFIGLDRFGQDYMGASFDQRIDTVVTLIDAGYIDRLLLAHDGNFVNTFMEPDWNAREQPDWDLEFIGRGVLPALRRRGVSEDQIDQMMVENPRRMLTPGVAY